MRQIPLFVFITILIQLYLGTVNCDTRSSLYNYDLNQSKSNLREENMFLEKTKEAKEVTNKTPKTNLTAISWAHAVNSQIELSSALDSDVDMIEADIVLGKLNSDGADMPIMGHPPQVTSDISLAEFLDKIISYNIMHLDFMKGIKLDFKSIEVFEGSLTILNAKIPQMSSPVWLNADIIRGPVNQNETIPVNPDRFFAGCSPFQGTILSIGWTTRWGPDFRDVDGYTADEINDMLQSIKRNNIHKTQQPITFPVRAGIAANSEKQLHDLVNAINSTNESTLTIWSSENDYVDIEKLRHLIFSFGVDRVYLDVPKEVSEKLDLGRSNASASVSLLNASLIYGMLVFCLLIGKF